MRGRESDWQEKAAPPIASMPEFLGAISAVGFAGVLVDRDAYADRGEAAEAERRGDGLAPLAPYALGAAYWKSAHDGLDGEAIDLSESHASVPAVSLLDGLIDHVRPALEAVGDYDMVRAEVARISEIGNGAIRQRRAWQGRHDIADVLAEAAVATLS